MSAHSDSRIGEQNQAYRKGLVLGLTMAEVGILIIFVLLLLLAFSELRRTARQREYAGKAVVDSVELARLMTARAVLDTIAEELTQSSADTSVGQSVADTSNDFVRLVRVLREAARAPEAQSQLAEARSTLDEIRRARQEMARVAEATTPGRGETLTKVAEQQSYRLANQEGQIKMLQDRLQRTGLGKGERPCWVQPNGTIDYLYEVVLTSAGIKMREVPNAARATERADLPAPVVDPDEVLPPGVFLARTAALFERSKQDNCRYFVHVYDATKPFEKPLYKDLLRTVEGHFYKLLHTSAAPF